MGSNTWSGWERVYEPEFSLAKEKAKVECEGHPLVKFVPSHG
jgi:hypothetical protein